MNHEHMKVHSSISSDVQLFNSYHANEVEQSPYNTLLPEFSSHSTLYAQHNLHCINTLRHSILCRDIFTSLSTGCSDYLHSKKDLRGWRIQVGDDELAFTIDQSFIIRIKLHSVEEPLYDEKAFDELIHEKSEPRVIVICRTNPILSQNSSSSLNQTSCIHQVLSALNRNIMIHLVKQQLSVYTTNPHYKPIKTVEEVQTQDNSIFVNSLLKHFSFLYHKLFVKYFMYVVSHQFEYLYESFMI